MGRLKDTASARTQVLEADHIVGRAQTSALCINERHVSAQHAILRCSAERWSLRDLGSRNGTFLNGERLKPGEEVTLRKGDCIAFGKLDHVWEVIDDDAPVAMAVPLDGGEPLPLQDERLTLPSSTDGRFTIYRDCNGFWMLAQPNGLSLISNLQTFEIDGRPFRFSCPDRARKSSP
ncbi:MAG: FHA domain-containing protein [Myxococcales bacterium]